MFTLECARFVHWLPKKAIWAKVFFLQVTVLSTFGYVPYFTFVIVLTFPQCTVNKGKVMGVEILALIVRKVRVFFSWHEQQLDLSPVITLFCMLGTERPVYSTRPPGTFPCVQDIKGSQGPWSLRSYSPVGFELEGMVMPMPVSSDFLATGSELTMPRVPPFLSRSHVADFPGCKLLILLFSVQRPLEILRISMCTGAWAGKWGIMTHWKMSSNCLNKILSGFFHGDWTLVSFHSKFQTWL